MNWSTIKDAIKAWAEDSSGLTAVWMNEARPITTKPFIVLQILSSVVEGIDYVDYTYSATPDPHLEPTVHGYRLLTVQVTAISRNQNAGYDALNYLELARTRLKRPVLHSALKEAGLAVNWNGQAIRVADQVFDNRYESRCIFDVIFRAVQTDQFTDSADYEDFIERAGVSSDIEGVSDPDVEFDNEIIGVPV